MAKCAVSGVEVMTSYYVRVKGMSPDASNPNSGSDHLFFSLDCNPEEVVAYLDSHLKPGEVYRFLWRPKGAAEIDQVEGIVGGEEDIAAAIAHFPFGGRVPRPYLTTEEVAMVSGVRQAKPIAGMGIGSFSGVG